MEKGVFQPNKIIKEKNIALKVSNPVRRIRRYISMRMKNKNWDGNTIIVQEIQKQFTKDMSFDNFLEVWDIDDDGKVVKL